MIGSAGAIAGVALALGAVATQLFGVGDASERARKAAESYAEGIEALNALLETEGERLARVRRERIEPVQSLRNAVADPGHGTVRTLATARRPSC